MCQLIETIRIENGEPLLLPLHQKRMDKARAELFGLDEPASLSTHLSSLQLPPKGIWKCRVTYGFHIEKTEFEFYQIKDVHSLKIIEADELNYNYKFAQRAEINKLFALKEHADDILIIKNKLVTDTSYCNVALWDGSIWMTPLHPLLKGIRRESLLQQKKIQSFDIRLNDLPSFQFIKLFNALISFDEATEISTSSIFS